MKTEDYKTSLYKRLKDPEYAAGYLTDVLAEESQEAFLIALCDIIEAREENVTDLSESGNPRLSTIKEVLNSMGLTLSVAQKELA